VSNRLKMAISETIITLWRRGWSGRRIAAELGVDRDTVSRHLRRPTDQPNAAIAPSGSATIADESNAAIAPTGSGDDATGSNAAIAPSGFSESSDGRALMEFGVESPATVSSPAVSSRTGRRSLCEPYRAVIVSAWERDLSAQRIYQDLVNEHGFTGKYFSVRRFVERLGRRSELPMRRMECAAGDEMQVDFGRGAPIVEADGRRRLTHVFRVVLSHSRKAYSEAVTRQTTENFLRCIENAMWHFGGVPRRVVLDNLKAAVQQADWFDPDLNPKAQAFARHYGTVFWPTKPYMPRHKGKIERGVGYVKGNALKGRTFASLAEQNQFLAEWERTVADTRIHGTTRRQVGPYFETVEKPALAALPAARFPCFQEARRVVNRDGHIEVERAYYSVPPEYLSRRVWARWDGRLVRVFNDRLEQIAVHVRHEPGRFSTQSQHIVNEKISGIERGAAWVLGRIRLVGPHCLRWAEACLQARGVEGVRVLQGLLSLTHRRSCAQLERACELAHSYGCYRLRTVRQLIDRDEPKQQHAFIDDDPIIRPLSDYTQFVHDAIQKGATS
jgi:transposase